MEEWKDIPGYEGLYQASTEGRIRSVDGKVTSSKKFKERRWKGRVLKGRGDNPVTGKRVSLWKNGNVKDWLVARLVALTFLGQPVEGYTVNHKDGNRFNNNVDNLEWLSRADNIRHGFETCLYHTQNSITVKSNSETLAFRSYAQFSLFLGRSKGYVSGRLKKGITELVDSKGNKYTIIKGSG